MKHFLFLLCAFVITKAYSQNQAYYVKQTQVSMDAKSWKALHNNPSFVKITFKEKGIEFSLRDGKYTLIEWDKIDKVNLEDNAYRYEVSVGEIDVVLFFVPSPYANSEIKFSFALVNMPGLMKENPKVITFFRLVFVDDLILNNYATE